MPASDFVPRVLTTIGLVALAVLTIYFLGKLLDVLLLIFASVLLAVAITGVRRVIDHFTPLSNGWSLAATYLLLVVLIAGSVAVVWPQLAAQIPEFIDSIPRAVEKLEEIIDGWPRVREAVGNLDYENLVGRYDVPTRLLGFFSTTLGSIASVSLIVLIAVYLTVSSQSYVDHLLILIPRGKRARCGELLRAQTKSMRYWLLGRLVSMVSVGVFTWIGLMLLGVPMAFTLGLIAGLATFIPYIGPILGAIPALMVALVEGPMVVLYVAIVYFVVETAESNLIYPLVTKKAVHLAPAYTVIIQLAGGVVAGIPGVILATPLAVVGAVAIQMLYVEDVLGENIEVLGS